MAQLVTLGIAMDDARRLACVVPYVALRKALTWHRRRVPAAVREVEDALSRERAALDRERKAKQESEERARQVEVLRARVAQMHTHEESFTRRYTRVTLSTAPSAVRARRLPPLLPFLVSKIRPLQTPSHVAFLSFVRSGGGRLPPWSRWTRGTSAGGMAG